MKTLRHSARARIAAVGIATSGALLLASCGAANETAAPTAPGGEAAATVSGSIAGAGATSQQAAQEAWIAGFGEANPEATIAYDGGGSGAGREQFVAGGIQFAGSDAYLDEEELPAAVERCAGSDIVELPLYISPIAIAFNLPGVTTLNLSPATIAGMFTGAITTWDDPAIAAENPDATLPAGLAVTPVNRSDDSGTTENFAEYLNVTAPDIWTYEPDGVWPAELAGGEAASGTSGVIGAISGGEGTIGYADASQAADLGKVSVMVGSEYVAPDPAAAAAVVEASPRVETQGEYSFAVDLQRDSTTAGTYPVVLVSYLIACSQYPDAAQADLVKAYFTYMLSAEGQEAAAANAGSAPISDAQRTDFQPAVDAISAAG